MPRTLVALKYDHDCFVVDECPNTKVWRTPTRPAEPDLVGTRNRALLLVGFVAALRQVAVAVDANSHGLSLLDGRCLTVTLAEERRAEEPNTLMGR